MQVSKEYLAGLFDGEGWLTFTKMPSGYIKCEVGISMIAPELTTMLSGMFPESRCHLDKSKAGVVKWVISGNYAEPFISLLEPYVIFKQPDFAWYRRWQNLPKAKPRQMSQEVMDARIQFIAEYKEWRLNRYKG